MKNIWNRHFDKILVLSLKESEDRREHIRREFQKNGIHDYEFFDATHFSSPELEIVKKSNKFYSGPLCFRCHQRRCSCINNFITDFQLANWISFTHLWKYILDNEWKFVMICEDDVVFTPHHKNTIFTLLSKHYFSYYKISLQKPLLIGMGGAYHPNKHFLKAPPHMRRQNVMCNPCFCLNRSMVKLFYDHYHIHHTSDHFMHIEIPKRFPEVQHYIMYPWPVYELSFVKGMNPFESLVRPKGGIRHKKYKEFCFMSSLLSMEKIFEKIIQFYRLPLNNYHYHGYTFSFLQMNEIEREKFRFEFPIYFTLGDEMDFQLFKIEYKNSQWKQKYMEYTNRLQISLPTSDSDSELQRYFQEWKTKILSILKPSYIMNLSENKDEMWIQLHSLFRIQPKFHSHFQHILEQYSSFYSSILSHIQQQNQNNIE